jgi:hypothetical protein
MLNFAIDKKNLDFYFFALIGGLLLDFFSTTYFGSYGFGFLLTGVFVYAMAGSLFFLEVNWKSLSLFLFGSLALLSFSLWFFNFAAFKFGWTVLYSPLKLYMTEFPANFFYNWLLLYPMYLVSNKLKDLISNFAIRSRGVVR